MAAIVVGGDIIYEVKIPCCIHFLVLLLITAVDI